LLMRIVKLLYNSFIWGMLAAVMAFQNTWLEMRMNIGYIIPLLMALVFLLVLVIGALRHEYKFVDRLNLKSTVVNLIVCSIAAFIVLGFDRLAIVPAAIVREGIKATGISFSIINAIIVTVLLLGTVALALNERQKKTS